MIEYPLASSTWNNLEVEAIQRVIESKNYTMGKFVKEYELKFAEYFGSKYCVMTSSGSTANLLMIAALFFTKKNNLVRGDEVIVPAVSWSTTFFPLQQYGLRVKFVDIDAGTLNFDMKKLYNAITQKTRVILAVNLLGNPNQFDEINKLIIGKNITLLEDNCESMGALYNGKYCGTFGIMGTFSSFFSHHISTMEGGCILTEDEELYHILLCLRAHGWTRNLPNINKVTGIKSESSFEESFKFVLPGYNARPLEMSGAIGIEQLKKLSNFIAMRRKNATIFKELFDNHPFINIQEEIADSSWFGFAIIIKEESKTSRFDLINLLNQKNIDCRPIVTGNFVKNKVLQYFDYEISGGLENAEYVDQNGLFVGNHHYNIEKQLLLLYNILKELN